MIERLNLGLCFYITTDSDEWPEWQTDVNGTVWYNLMGMSWEEMEPDEDLLESFLEIRDEALLAAVTRSATNGD